MGVARIDMFKRSNVSSALECAFDELSKREREIVSALAAPTDKTEFAYGRLCGMYQENQVSRSLLERCLNEGDPVREHREER
jgi:hypothetical protein